MSKPLSVLMLVPQLDRIGGYERQALQLSAALASSGVAVQILTDQIGHFPAKEFRSGFHIYRLQQQSSAGMVLGTFFFLLRRLRFFNIVHCHGYSGFAFFAMRIAQILGRPVIVKLPTQNDMKHIFETKDRRHRFYRKVMKKVSSFVAVSDEIAQEIQSYGIPSGRIVRIPNFVNTVKFVAPSPSMKSDLRMRLNVPPEEMLFLSLGRLDERKGIDVLLRAWSKTKEGLLWIVGSGPEETRLKKLASELNLQRCQFLGPTQNPLDFYQVADVFVLSSLREGSPNVLLEAMSCRLACIATRIGGVTDILQEEIHGLLVEPGDADQLAQALNSAHDKAKTERWSEAASLHVRKNFDLSVVIARYVKLYDALLE